MIYKYGIYLSNKKPCDMCGLYLSGTYQSCSGIYFYATKHVILATLCSNCLEHAEEAIIGFALGLYGIGAQRLG